MVSRATPIPDEAAQEAAEQILGALRRIIHAVDLHSRYLMREHGLSAPQVVILRALHRLGQTPVGALARYASLSQATVTGILDRLQRRGWVERQDCALDRRRTLVSLTPAGADVVLTAPPPLQERFIAQMAGLADWERTQLLASMQRLAGMLEASNQVEPVDGRAGIPERLDAP